MFNNIGIPGLVLLILVVGLPIWLIVKIMKSSKRKATEQKRIADALEDIAKSKKNDEGP